MNNNQEHYVILSFSFRYETICCPFRKCKSHRRIHRTIILCWISSFIVAIPQLFIFEESLIPGSTNEYRCASTGYHAEWQRQLYFTIFASYVLFIPLICMSFWYIRIISVVGTSMKIWTQALGNETDKPSTAKLTTPTKIKTIKLALMIIIVFTVCWIPYLVFTLIEVYSDGRIHLPSWFDGTLQAICLLQSGLNPIIYMSFNKERRYSPVLVLAAASTASAKTDQKRHRYRRERGGSISFCSIGEEMYRRRGTSFTQF